ncbi:hypothetical protein GCM10023174_11000 [Chelativorans composti]|jgi:Sulfatase.|uniref:LTA synthase family protein n=1 Tax=Chelativorans composti TaxID=768533 RepID=A0ABW5DFJ3_9HYPH|nr:LTA synthase family protein [bacterium SGD-2]
MSDRPIITEQTDAFTAQPAARQPARRIAWDRTWPFHPMLLAASSVLTLMSNNMDFTGWDDVTSSLVVALVLAGSVHAIIAVIRGRLDATSAIIASIWVAGILYYFTLFGGINRWLEGGFPMVRSLPVAIALLVAATAFALRLDERARQLNGALNLIAVVFLLVPFCKIVEHQWIHRGALDSHDPAAAMAEIDPFITGAASGEAPPDIFHIIFDRYASEGVLRRYFGVDNSDVGRFLEDRGFYLARGSNSNYQKTGHSIASTLHMGYLDALARDPRVKGQNWRPIHKMLDDHRVGRFLKSRGYRIIQFGSWWVGTFRSSLADENRPHGFSEFAMLYWRTTMARPVFHVLPDTPFTMRLDWDNGQCQRIRPQIEEIKNAGRDGDRPVYVLAHILIPHGPENFTATGECLSLAEAAKRGQEKGYLEQIEYANRIIRELVMALQEPGRRPAVIILQADEGPFPKRDGTIPWHEAPADELRIKTGILNAYYFPGRDYSGLWQDITPVNTYRVVFNTYFGTRLPMLEDKIYAFPFDSNIYEFHDVTSRVRGPGPVAGARRPARRSG